MDFLNRALDQAKELQKIASDALDKTHEQAKPLIDDAMRRAQPHLETLAKNASSAASAALDALREATKPKGR